MPKVGKLNVNAMSKNIRWYGEPSGELLEKYLRSKNRLGQLQAEIINPKLTYSKVEELTGSIKRCRKFIGFVEATWPTQAWKARENALKGLPPKPIK